jgi:alkylation response protein AidB-like acyl-CoA dehydrogenase
MGIFFLLSFTSFSSLSSSSILMSGEWAFVERFYRDVRVAAIGGGSEEVMVDLGVNLTIGRAKM